MKIIKLIIYHVKKNMRHISKNIYFSEIFIKIKQFNVALIGEILQSL